MLKKNIFPHSICILGMVCTSNKYASHVQIFPKFFFANILDFSIYIFSLKVTIPPVQIHFYSSKNNVSRSSK